MKKRFQNVRTFRIKNVSFLIPFDIGHLYPIYFFKKLQRVIYLIQTSGESQKNIILNWIVNHSAFIDNPINNGYHLTDYLTNWQWAFSTVHADFTGVILRSQLLTWLSFAVTNCEQPWWGFHFPVVKRGWPLPSKIPECISYKIIQMYKYGEKI